MEIYSLMVSYAESLTARTSSRRPPVGKHIVKLDRIICPVLNLIAGEDDLVPCGQSVPFTECVALKDGRTILLKGSGHVGLAIGSRAQKELWPQACEWLGQRDA